MRKDTTKFILEICYAIYMTIISMHTELATQNVSFYIYVIKEIVHNPQGSDREEEKIIFQVLMDLILTVQQ